MIGNSNWLQIKPQKINHNIKKLTLNIKLNSDLILSSDINLTPINYETIIKFSYQYNTCKINVMGISC